MGTAITSADAAFFSVDDKCNGSLAANTKCTATATYPTGAVAPPAGTHTAKLTIIGAGKTLQVISLSGTQ